MSLEIPEHLKQYLGEFGPQVYDGCCEEPIGWGYEIIKRCGDDIWSSLSAFGEQTCLHGEYNTTWVLVTRKLTREDAETLYGPIIEEIFGPRGGWKSVTFGEKKFISDDLKSKK